MRIIKILFLILSIFYILSCNNDNYFQDNQYLWLNISINNETLVFKDLTINGIKENSDIYKDEYIKQMKVDPVSSEEYFRRNHVFLFKFPKSYTIDDLKNYKIEIKDNDTVIWTGFVYNENEFSKCGFYQMKDEPNKDKIKEVFLNFFERDENNKLILEGKYYADIGGSLICDNGDAKNKVMISVNLANNTFDNNYIEKINGVNVDNGRENNYIWHNFRNLLEKSGLSSLYIYKENQDGFGKSSSYWNLMVDRSELKDYKLEFLSKSGKKTIKNLNEIQFCATPDEKSFDELIDDFKVLTYGVTIKDGVVKVEYQGALDNNNRMVNCSKISGETSGISFSPSYLLRDRYGDINITKYNGNNTNYHFTDNWQKIYYYNKSGDSDEYKKFGLKRWGLTVYTHFTSNTEDGFALIIPWHLVKEGESLMITSDMIEEQTESEKSFFSLLLKPLYYSHETGISFSSQGFPIINYGNYQKVTYNFNKVPKKYGDFLEINFHILAKQDEETVLDYEGTINSRYLGEDIFHCFNNDKLWICPKEGFEENYPWLNN